MCPMTSSIRLRVSPRAERDVETFLQYTLRMWGEERRILYDALLWEAFRRIQAFPDIGREADEARPNIREYHLEHHTILYRRESGAVTILRVINPRRLRRSTRC